MSTTVRIVVTNIKKKIVYLLVQLNSKVTLAFEEDKIGTKLNQVM